MLMMRGFGRTLFAAAKRESSASAGGAWSVQNPVEEFVEDEKPLVSGRAWKPSELQYKSWDDLNKLSQVLNKENHILMSEKQKHRLKGLGFPYVERLSEVKKSMSRVKYELSMRANEEPDARNSAETRRIK